MNSNLYEFSEVVWHYAVYSRGCLGCLMDVCVFIFEVWLLSCGHMHVSDLNCLLVKICQEDLFYTSC
jgi:hypothetical protein